MAPASAGHRQHQLALYEHHTVHRLIDPRWPALSHCYLKVLWVNDQCTAGSSLTPRDFGDSQPLSVTTCGKKMAEMLHDLVEERGEARGEVGVRGRRAFCAFTQTGRK